MTASRCALVMQKIISASFGQFKRQIARGMRLHRHTQRTQHFLCLRQSAARRLLPKRPH